MATPQRVLVFDIETAPKLAFVWRLFRENISLSQLIEGTFMLTWAAKWYGEDDVMEGALTQKEILDQDDRRIVGELANLVREADIVLAHNGDRFDIPILNARLAYHRLEPLGYIKSIDTLKHAKKDLRLDSNKLDYLGEFFLGERKLKVDFELWRDVYQGDMKAMARMQAYNVKDVILLEKVFDEMKPYCNRLPRLFRATKDREFACPYCGSEDLWRRGYYETQASVFVKYQCQDCSKYSRKYSSEKDKRFAVHPI